MKTVCAECGRSWMVRKTTRRPWAIVGGVSGTVFGRATTRAAANSELTLVAEKLSVPRFVLRIAYKPSVKSRRRKSG